MQKYLFTSCLVLSERWRTDIAHTRTPQSGCWECLDTLCEAWLGGGEKPCMHGQIILMLRTLIHQSFGCLAVRLWWVKSYKELHYCFIVFVLLIKIMLPISWKEKTWKIREQGEEVSISLCVGHSQDKGRGGGKEDGKTTGEERRGGRRG